MLVTPLGIVRDASASLYANDYTLMLVTPLGIEIDDRAVQC
jgi:hypothetical protein